MGETISPFLGIVLTVVTIGAFLFEMASHYL